MFENQSSFTCERGGLRIRGTAYIPELSGKMPALIYCHGLLDSQKGGPAPFVQTGVDAGYAVFTFDFCGGGVRGISDGKTTDMSVLTEIEDLKAVIDYVKSLPYIDEARINLMGQSQGGFVCAMTAAKRKDIESLILFYPAFCIPDYARKGTLMYAVYDPADPPEVIPCGPMNLGRCYPMSVMEMDPWEEIRGYEGRILLLHGTADRLVDAEYARKASALYEEEKPGRISAVLLEGAGHGFKGEYADRAKALMKAFLEGRSISSSSVTSR